MMLLDLPLELLQSISYHSIQCRGIKRGLRLRLVNKTFEKEVIQALFSFRLLDPYFHFEMGRDDSRLPPFSASYLEYRIMNEPEGGIPGLLHIRAIAKQLSLESDKPINAESVRPFVRELCFAAIRIMGFRVSGLFAAGTSPQLDFEKDLFIAAVCTNTTAAIEKLIDGLDLFSETSSLFGGVRLYALEFGNTMLLARILRHPSCEGKVRQSFMIRAAAIKGSLDTVKFVYNFINNDVPWEFPDGSEQARNPAEALLMAPLTPSVDICNFIMNLRKKHMSGRELDIRTFDKVLEICAGKGWTDMASHLVGLGACVDGPSNGLSRPIITACKNGHLEVVKILLQNGASTKGAVDVASKGGHLNIVRALLEHGSSMGEYALERATARGYRDIVELLLDHGDEMRESVPDSLHRVIEMEHVSLFHLLMDRGLDPGQSTKEKCVERARDLGLQSMLDLLRSRGWVT